MRLNRPEPLWRKMLDRADVQARIILPEVNESHDQDAEWCHLEIDGKRRRLRFHDYDKIYRVPGLYERLFYETLECTSPARVADLLDDVLQDFDDDARDLRVLDVGGGNGMVAEELREIGVGHAVGIDIIPEAKDAALRDRPRVYDDYVVADLTDLDEKDEKKLRKQSLNCLCTVAALGFGDIPPAAFIKALDLVETPAWMAFNIKEDFIYNEDSTGFCKLIRQLSEERIIQIEAWRRYCHRRSMQGKRLHYVAMIARKLKDLPDHMMMDA